IILQAWLTLPSCLANSSSPTLARMIFCSLVIVGVLSKRRGRALRTPTTPRPASASASAMTPTVRLSLNYCTSADCASSWLQELLTLLLQLQHVLRRTQIDPFVERERGQQGRAPINQLHEFDVPVARANAAPYHTRLECHLILSSGVRPCAMYQVRLHGGLGDELVDPGRALPSFLKSARRSMPGTDRGRDRRLPNAGGK